MDDLFLGRVDYANGDWARLEPLAVLSEGTWCELADRVAEFPDEGLVFAPPFLDLGRAPAGSLWTFSREPNERASAGRDKYIVAGPSAAVPLVDLSACSVEAARKRLFEEGVRLPQSESTEAVAMLADGLCCVVEFEPMQHGTYLARTPPQLVPLMTAPQGWLRSGTVQGQRFLPEVAIPALHVVRRVNWCSDADFVERVLLRVRRHANQIGDTALAVPGRDAIQRIARALQQNDLLPGSQDDVELNLERLRSQWPTLEARFEAAEAMRSFVLESKLAKERIEAAANDARVSEAARLRPMLEQQIREELGSSLKDIHQQRDIATAELDAVRVRLLEQQARLGAVECDEKQASQRLAALGGELRARLASLRDGFEGLTVGELPHARALVERLESALDGQSANLLPSLLPPWAAPTEPFSAEAIDLDALGEQLIQQGKAYGVDCLETVDAFARAGELVLLTGPHAERCLTAYARSVSGGEIRAMVLDPSVIGLDDLWSTPSGRHPTAFAHAWNRAKAEPDRTIVACLRSIDAAPMHLWLPTLSAVLRSNLRPRNLLLFATTLGLAGTESGDYPHRDNLVKWLTPLQPAQGKGGGLAALRSLSPRTPKPSALHWETPRLSESVSSEAFVSLVSEADVETVARAATLAASIFRGPDVDRSLLARWVGLVGGKGASDAADGLKDGVDALGSLNYQH